MLLSSHRAKVVQRFDESQKVADVDTADVDTASSVKTVIAVRNTECPRALCIRILPEKVRYNRACV